MFSTDWSSPFQYSNIFLIYIPHKQKQKSNELSEQKNTRLIRQKYQLNDIFRAFRKRWESRERLKNSENTF